MMTTLSFLEELEREADDAAASEKKFRREASKTIKSLERERAFSFRRLNLVRALAEGMKDAKDPESAVANAMAIFRSKLGWADEEGDSKSMVCSHFAPVAQTIFANLAIVEEPCSQDLAGELFAFESWYASTHSAPFWVLFEQHMPDTPSVDF